MKFFINLLICVAMITSSANAQNGHYAEVNGLHMYYEEYGKGKPVVLIHGAASTVQTSFGRLIPELSKTHRIIGVELQAHGHSDNRDGRPVSFEQDAADVVELLRQLHIERADFFGFSNGATTALVIAIHHPLLVDKLIFASSMYKRSGCAPAFWQGFGNPRIEEMPALYKSTFLAINPDQASFKTMFDQCVQRMQKFTDIPDSSVEAIQSKTLIILGDHDVPLVEGALAMSRLMPHASLAVFPGGHGAYMGEIIGWKENDEPPVALPLISRFLKDAAQ
ncbi:MAG TPA: alpha/beta hydrolase [Puia sp.]|nr:alpha/beta hydrolase [Puia sp.]